MTSKYKVNRKRRRYGYGSTMYAPNVIGDVPQNTTENTVFEESDPRLQEARMLGFEQEVDRLTKKGQDRSDEIETQQELDENEVELHKAESDQKHNAGKAAISTGLKTAKTLGFVGQNLSKAAVKGGGIGSIAAMAGTGISMLSDDKDATKWNAGEVTGDLMSSAGTGAAWGSLLGPAGTIIGGVAGAGYGLVKGLTQRRKARDEEQKLTDKRVRENKEENVDAIQSWAGQKSRARQGELYGKTYSGYDLGRNTVAKYGGLKKYI